MTPDQFTTAATAWIAAVVSIAAIAIPAYFKIKGMINNLNSAHLENRARIDLHDAQQGILTSATATVKDGATTVRTETLPDPQAFRHPLSQPQTKVTTDL